MNPGLFLLSARAYAGRARGYLRASRYTFIDEYTRGQNRDAVLTSAARAVQNCAYAVTVPLTEEVKPMKETPQTIPEPEARRGYKLTNAAMQTYGGFQWTLDAVVERTGEGELCGVGWLHAYLRPNLALFLDPIHGNFAAGRRLFAVDYWGDVKHDRGLKFGATGMRLVEELPVPEVTPAKAAYFARLCADWAAEAANGPRLTPEGVADALEALAVKALA